MCYSDKPTRALDDLLSNFSEDAKHVHNVKYIPSEKLPPSYSPFIERSYTRVSRAEAEHVLYQYYIGCLPESDRVVTDSLLGMIHAINPYIQLIEVIDQVTFVYKNVMRMAITGTLEYFKSYIKHCDTLFIVRNEIRPSTGATITFAGFKNGYQIDSSFSKPEKQHTNVCTCCGSVLPRKGIHRVVMNLGSVRRVGRTSLLQYIANTLVQEHGVKSTVFSTYHHKKPHSSFIEYTTHASLISGAYFAGRTPPKEKLIIIMDDATKDEIERVIDRLSKEPPYVWCDVDIYVSTRDI